MSTTHELHTRTLQDDFYTLVFNQAKNPHQEDVETREERIVNFAVDNNIHGEDLNTALLLFRSYIEVVDEK